MQLIESCIKSYAKERSPWETFREIFYAPPEWMEKKDTIAGLLQSVQQSIGTISIITAANTHQKVCEMQQQIEGINQMMKMGLEVRKPSRNTSPRQIPSSTDSKGGSWSREKREKACVSPSSALSPQEADSRAELEASLANLVATTDKYIWYG